MYKYFLQSELSLSKSKTFAFLDSEKRTFLEASQDPLTEGLDSLINDFTFVPFTISLKDPKGQEIFSLHKKRSSPFSSVNFVLIYSGGRILFQEGKRFEMPNIRFESMGRSLDIMGRVMDLSFSLVEEDKKLASFVGKRMGKGKEYQIEILDPSLPKEVYFACALIIDNLYHDY